MSDNQTRAGCRRIEKLSPYRCHIQKTHFFLSLLPVFVCVYFPLHLNNISEYVKVSMEYKYFEIEAQGSKKSQTKNYRFMGKKVY